MSTATATDISLKAQEYVGDLLEEFSADKPEITKTERSRNLRRNKDGSFIVTEIKIKLYLATEKSMIIRTIEETTRMTGDHDDLSGQTVRRRTVTKKYASDGNTEWTRENEEENDEPPPYQEEAVSGQEEPATASYENTTIRKIVQQPDRTVPPTSSDRTNFSSTYFTDINTPKKYVATLSHKPEFVQTTQTNHQISDKEVPIDSKMNTRMPLSKTSSSSSSGSADNNERAASKITASDLAMGRFKLRPVSASSPTADADFESLSSSSTTFSNSQNTRTYVTRLPGRSVITQRRTYSSYRS